MSSLLRLLAAWLVFTLGAAAQGGLFSSNGGVNHGWVPYGSGGVMAGAPTWAFCDCPMFLAPCANGGVSTQNNWDRSGCCGTNGISETVCGLLCHWNGGSVSAADLVLRADHLPPGNPGIFFVGTSISDPGVPFGDGLSCLHPSILMLSSGFETGPGFRLSDPAGPGSLIGEGNLSNPGYFVPAQTYYFQYFYMDQAAGPSPCGTGANISSGVGVTLLP